MVNISRFGLHLCLVPLISGHAASRKTGMKNHLDFEQPIVDLQAKLDALTKTSLPEGVEVDFQDEADQIRTKIEKTRNSIYSNLSSWQRVQLARHPRRPYTLDYIRNAFDDFYEFHIANWMLSSSNDCVIRATNLKTQKVTEYTYRYRKAAQHRIEKLIGTHEFVVCDHEAIHRLSPNPQRDNNEETNTRHQAS